MSDALRLAFGTLTAWKVPPPRRIDSTVAGRAMLLAPLAVLPLAILMTAAALATFLLPDTPVSVVAALLVAAHVLSTRAMHLDGLADTADGLSASYDRARALEIMKRSDIGPSGVGAIAVALLIETAALATCCITASGVALAAVALLASRHTLVWGCRRGYPCATGQGLGKTMSESVSRAAVAAAAVVMLAGGAVVGWVAGAPAWAGPVVVVVAVTADAALLRRARRRLGGMTGDVLGAGIEISYAAALVAAAFLTHL